jgi:hypothetical protein
MLSNYFGNNFSSISTSVTTIAVYKVHYLPADLLAIAAQLNIGQSNTALLLHSTKSKLDQYFIARLVKQ